MEWLIPAGFGGKFLGSVENVTPTETQKTAEIRPFLYIFINVTIFIYIQPPENKNVYSCIHRGGLSPIRGYIFTKSVTFLGLSKENKHLFVTKVSRFHFATY